MSSVTVNGKPRALDGPASVSDFLATLDINPRQVAVALNGEVVPRGDWPRTTIHPGDTVEIVRAVGGGGL